MEPLDPAEAVIVKVSVVESGANVAERVCETVTLLKVYVVDVIGAPEVAAVVEGATPSTTMLATW
jgi:hypothetical protein